MDLRDCKMAIQRHLNTDSKHLSDVNNIIQSVIVNKAGYEAVIGRLTAPGYARNTAESEHLVYLQQKIDWLNQLIFQLNAASSTLTATLDHGVLSQANVGGGQYVPYYSDEGEAYVSRNPGAKESPEPYRYIHRNDGDNTVDSDYSEC